MTTHEQPAPTATVDARGLACPQPVIDLSVAVDALEVGQRVELLADDPAAAVDVPVWCRMRRQRLLDVEDLGTHHRFLVERLPTG